MLTSSMIRKLTVSLDHFFALVLKLTHFEFLLQFIRKIACYSRNLTCYWNFRKTYYLLLLLYYDSFTIHSEDLFRNVGDLIMVTDFRCW